MYKNAAIYTIEYFRLLWFKLKERLAFFSVLIWVDVAWKIQLRGSFTKFVDFFMWCAWYSIRWMFTLPGKETKTWQISTLPDNYFLSRSHSVRARATFSLPSHLFLFSRSITRNIFQQMNITSKMWGLNLALCSLKILILNNRTLLLTYTLLNLWERLTSHI